MKRLIFGSLFTVLSVLSFTPIALAENWVSVATDEDTGKTYLIDLDSRYEYTSKTGWRHIAFKIYSDSDRYSYGAIAACKPYQIYVPKYNWDWTSDTSYSYPVRSLGGRLARAACNW